jgi:hypothetical protein
LFVTAAWVATALARLMLDKQGLARGTPGPAGSCPGWRPLRRASSAEEGVSKGYRWSVLGGDREIQNGGDGALSPVRAGHDQGEDAARRTLVEFRDGAGMAVDVNVGLSRTSRGGNSNSSSGDNAWMGLFQE